MALDGCLLPVSFISHFTVKLFVVSCFSVHRSVLQSYTTIFCMSFLHVIDTYVFSICIVFFVIHLFACFSPFVCALQSA